tara:strand:- start:59186 stop:59431 length:246 start_codon:yes stop_codon:yes gene_type:complete
MELFDTENENSEQSTVEEGGVDSSEAAFMHGYNSDGENTKECEECGVAIQEEDVEREIEGQMHKFCSKICADEFEEGIGPA